MAWLQHAAEAGCSQAAGRQQTRSRPTDRMPTCDGGPAGRAPVQHTQGLEVQAQLGRLARVEALEPVARLQPLAMRPAAAGRPRQHPALVRRARLTLQARPTPPCTTVPALPDEGVGHLGGLLERIVDIPCVDRKQPRATTSSSPQAGWLARARQDRPAACMAEASPDWLTYHRHGCRPGTCRC